MHIELFLHNLLSSVMHLKRLGTLIELVSGLLRDKKLSVTHLGRSIINDAKEKNNIKRSDRFISNKHLWQERFSIYAMMALRIVGATTRPLIIVDWSHIPNTTCYQLRAAVVARGRALTLYEEVFPKRLENNPEVHRRFLKKIKKLLPSHCIPILLTDAGFGKSWFKLVVALGWDYVGRVRGITTYRLEQNTSWRSYKGCGAMATSTPVYLGKGDLTQKDPLNCHFYLVKIPKKYRISLNKLKKKSHYKNDIEHAKSANEPWLLVSSLKKMPKTVVKMYSFRMEIEEGFRDLKSSKFGFSFEKAHSVKIRRIQILLMIATLAALIAFFTGWVAEKNQWHYQFQANTYKHKRVISLFFLGCRVIKKKLNLIWQDISDAFLEMKSSLNSMAYCDEKL
jgi:hypothetical protein